MIESFISILTRQKLLDDDSQILQKTTFHFVAMAMYLSFVIDEGVLSFDTAMNDIMFIQEIW